MQANTKLAQILILDLLLKSDMIVTCPSILASSDSFGHTRKMYQSM